MSNFVEEFIVGLGFQFEGEDGEKFKKQTERISSALNALTTAAAAALAATFAVAKKASDQAYESQKAATAIDTNAKALRGWQNAAVRAGVSADSVTGSLQGLYQMSQEAMRNGTGPFRAFQELDVDFQGIADGSVDVTEAMDRIIAKAQTLDRATAQSGLRELGINVRFLDTPIEDLRKYITEFEKWGGVTDKLNSESNKFVDTTDRLMTRLGGLTNALTERTLPAFTKFFEVLIEGLEWVLTEGLPIMDKFVEKCGGWETVIGGLAVVAIPALIGTMGILLKLITGITAAFTGGTAAAGAFMRAGMLGIAGYAGWKAGEQINDKLPTELKDQIGEYVARSLAFLGVEEAKKAVEINNPVDPNAPGWSSNEALGLIGNGPAAFGSNEQMQKDYEAARAAHPEDYPIAKPTFTLPPNMASKDSATALRDAIIGRESGGNTNAESPKGAAGLMQLMPDTAKDTAASLGLPYDQTRLKTDPEYNKTLGVAYLQQMLQRYGGSEGMAVAAYNAGPGMVGDWVNGSNRTGKNESGTKLGDPRTGEVSMSDWIANIPFKETREYTGNVLADKERIVGSGAAAGGATTVTRNVTNNFNGLKQTEIENLLQRAEEEEQTYMANEAKDAIVR